MTDLDRTPPTCTALTKPLLSPACNDSWIPSETSQWENKEGIRRGRSHQEKNSRKTHVRYAMVRTEKKEIKVRQRDNSIEKKLAIRDPARQSGKETHNRKSRIWQEKTKAGWIPRSSQARCKWYTQLGPH
jgi:hypothetical protein